jgi:hypothetical protein
MVTTCALCKAEYDAATEHKCQPHVEVIAGRPTTIYGYVRPTGRVMTVPIPDK